MGVLGQCQRGGQIGTPDIAAIDQAEGQHLVIGQAIEQQRENFAGGVAVLAGMAYQFDAFDDNERKTRIEVRSSDFRIRRFAERREATIVFAVDASGSAAFARLAEAKGAIELLLAQAYARRDHVSLLAFKGLAAELVP